MESHQRKIIFYTTNNFITRTKFVYNALMMMTTTTTTEELQKEVKIFKLVCLVL